MAASYLGSHTDRLWNQVAINPGVFLGLGPCTLGGVFYPTCSTNANLNQRRVFSLSGENPAAARLIGNLDIHTDLGTQDYRGLKLSFQRRAASGVSLSGNYTVSRCFGDPALQTGGFPQIADGYTEPRRSRLRSRALRSGSDAHRQLHRGRADAAVRHAARCALWPRTGGCRASSARARARRQRHRRPGPRVHRHPESAGQSGPRQSLRRQDVNNWLNPAAFALPAPGTLGNFKRNSVRAPGFWTVDVALSRLVPLAAAAALELRVETFNLFNTFNWARYAPKDT